MHAFVNELQRPVGTYVCGRKLYETMVYWDTAPTADPEGSVADDFAGICKAADQIVCSTSPEQRTTVERVFDPDAVSAFAKAAEPEVSIGGPHLGAPALRASVRRWYDLKPGTPSPGEQTRAAYAGGRPRA